MSKELKQAMVLAHGVGEHCFPFGGDKCPRPKYAFEVANVPLVKRAVDQVLALGVDKVWVVAGFQAQAIEQIVSQSYADGRVEVITVDNYRSGDVVATLAAVRKANVRGNLLVVNGDLLAFEADYRGLANAFAEVNGAYPVALYDELGEEEDKPSWHTVELMSDGKRVAYVKGHVEEGKFRLSGMYAIDANSLAMSSELSLDPSQPMYLASALQQAISQGMTIGAVRAQDEVVHVDRCFDYLDANQTVVMREAKSIADRKGAYVYRAGEGKPNPEFIYPGTMISPGTTVVMEEGAFISPYETREQHLAALKSDDRAMAAIRIRGDLYLGKNSRIGPNALIEGNLVVGEETYIEDAIVQRGVLIGNKVGVRRFCFIRSLTALADRSRFECAADFEGVAGTGTIWMHPGQHWIVSGRSTDMGAGNFVGTWRFDSRRCEYMIGGRSVKPGKDRIDNASYLGDDVRTGVAVFLTPGTRVGSNTLLSMGLLAHGTYDAGYFYAPKQEVIRLRTGFVRPKKKK